MWVCGVRDKIASEVEVDERADVFLASVQVTVLNPARTGRSLRFTLDGLDGVNGHARTC